MALERRIWDRGACGSSVEDESAWYSMSCPLRCRLSSSREVLNVLIGDCWACLLSIRPWSIKRSILMRFAMNKSFGNVECCPTCNIRANLSGVGSERIYQKSLNRVFGQIVIVPLNFWSHILDQSCPRGRGSSSRWCKILSHLLRSSLRYVSTALPINPPLHPRPRRCETGRPTAPRDEKKNRLMWGFTWLTMLKLTLKCRFKAFNGISVRRLWRSQHWLPDHATKPTCHLSSDFQTNRAPMFHHASSSSTQPKTVRGFDIRQGASSNTGCSIPCANVSFILTNALLVFAPVPQQKL